MSVSAIALQAALLSRHSTLQETPLNFGGSILTMAGDKPAHVEALAVKDGKILFAGSKDLALALKGETTKVINLDGKALLPAFIDAHGHYINSLLVANQAKVCAPP